jgi:hypothetical protein
MRHSSHASSGASGFALIELLVTAAVTAVVLVSICGIYLAVSRDWDRSRGESEALVATTDCCSVIGSYIEQAVGAVVLDRPGGDDAICLQMPADTSSGGIYTPVWGANSLNYRGGGWLIFYLSDSSGSYHYNGNILWAATMDWSDFPWSITPDPSWSLYYGDSAKGRIAPLKNVTFAMSQSGQTPVVTITATACYNVAGTERQVVMTRTVLMRNYVEGGG